MEDQELWSIRYDSHCVRFDGIHCPTDKKTHCWLFYRWWGKKYDVYYNLPHLYSTHIQQYFTFLWLALGPIWFFLELWKKNDQSIQAKENKEWKKIKRQLISILYLSCLLSKSMNKYIFILIGLFEKAEIIEVSFSPLLYEK